MQIWLQASGFSHSSMSGTWRREEDREAVMFGPTIKNTLKTQKSHSTPYEPSYRCPLLLCFLYFSNNLLTFQLQVHKYHWVGSVLITFIMFLFHVILHNTLPFWLWNSPRCPFTSTSLLVQEFVPGWAVTFVTDPPVSADVGTAAVVVLAFIHSCEGGWW